MQAELILLMRAAKNSLFRLRVGNSPMYPDQLQKDLLRGIGGSPTRRGRREGGSVVVFVGELRFRRPLESDSVCPGWAWNFMALEYLVF